MSPTQVAILVVIVAAVAAFLAFIAVKALDRLRKVDAENAAKQIMERAEREAGTKVKEAELAIKEKALAPAPTAKNINSALRPMYTITSNGTHNV